MKNGDVDAAFKTAARVVEAEYEWPFQSHASMGPGCAVVDAKKDSATVWTGTQKPHFARDGVANLLGLPPEKVHAVRVTGPVSYGRNDSGDTVIDAALLSKLTGRPVRVQGTRRDGMWDPKGPACVHRGRAALDASGKVIAYEIVSRGFSRVNIGTNESDPSDSLAGMELGMPLKPQLGFGTPAESYGFDNKRLAWEVIAPLVERSSPLRTSHLRDPVGPEIHFASEQFIDELAVAAGEDPVAFRLRYLTAPRDAAVVRAAAEKSGWQPRPASRGPRTGDLLTGRGISYAQRSGTIVAVVAEIEVERKTGRIWGRKFTVAHDCGLIINPEGLRYTIEGNVVHGLSRTLHEEVRFDRNTVTSVDWATYPILDFGDAPERIDVVLINRPEVGRPHRAPPEPGRIVRVVPEVLVQRLDHQLVAPPLAPREQPGDLRSVPGVEDAGDDHPRVGQPVQPITGFEHLLVGAGLAAAVVHRGLVDAVQRQVRHARACIGQRGGPLVVEQPGVGVERDGEAPVGGALHQPLEVGAQKWLAPYKVHRCGPHPHRQLVDHPRPGGLGEIDSFILVDVAVGAREEAAVGDREVDLRGATRGRAQARGGERSLSEAAGQVHAAISSGRMSE